jgi:hypothetical protein
MQSCEEQQTQWFYRAQIEVFEHEIALALLGCSFANLKKRLKAAFNPGP